MNHLKNLLSAIKTMLLARKDIALRLLYVLFFAMILGLLKGVVILVVLAQAVYVLITTRHHPALRDFSNKLVGYTYRVMRYITLNENPKPYPFGDFPANIERPDPVIRYR